MMADKPEFIKENQLFHSIIDASPAGMVITSDEGIIRMINQQILEWFGYQEDELVGKPVETLTV